MDPIAFSIGSFDVRWYGVIIATGMMIAMALVWLNAKKKNQIHSPTISG